MVFLLDALFSDGRVLDLAGAEANPASDLAAEDFPSHAVCMAGSAKVCCCP